MSNSSLAEHQARCLRLHVKADVIGLSPATTMSATKINSANNHEPISEILTEINLAATAIADLGSLIARLFADVNSQLPSRPEFESKAYDIRTSPGAIPPPASAHDQLFSIARIALRWNCRTQCAYERLAKAHANLVYFGRTGYLRLSDLLAIEQKLSATLKPFPSRQKRTQRE
jgi:hypothetical protein